MRLGTVLKIVAVVVLVAAVGLIAAAKSLDSKRYQTFLAEQVKAASGLMLTFSGPTKLKLGLSPQISFTGMALATRAEASPMLYIDRIEAQVALLPLIFRELRLERVTLFRPVLRLETMARPMGVLDLATPAETEKVPVTRLAVTEIRMEDATILWRAATTGPESRLVLAQARIQPETVDGGPLTLQANGAWNGTTFELGGVLGSPHALVSGKPYPVQLKAGIDGTVMTARGTVAEPLSAKGIDLELRAQGDELADLLRRAGIALGGKPVAAAGPYKMSAKLFDAPGGGYGLSDIDAMLGKRDNLLLGLKGEVKTLAPLAGVELAVSAEADSLAGLSRLIAVDLPVAGPLKLTARLHEMEGGWRLTGIKSTLGRSDFSGELALAQGPRPRFFGRLAATSFVPTDLSFPLTRAGDQSRQASPQRPAIPVIDGRILSLDSLPLDGLKVFDLDLSLVAAKLHVGPAALADASAEIHLAGGKLAVEAFSAQLGDGRVTGEARLDTTARTPGFSLRLTGTGLDIAKLGGESPPASGLGELAVTLRGGGSSPRTLAGSLDGSAWVNLGETTLARTSGDDVAPRLIAALDSSAVPADKEAPVKLRCAALRVTVKGGLLHADKGIALETARAAVLGSGTVDLRTEAIDLAFVARGGGGARLRGMLASPILVTDEPAAKLAPDASPCRTLAKLHH